MLLEAVKFIFYSILIVLISKYVLVNAIRKLGENLNVKAKTVGNIAGVATSVPELLTISASSVRGLYGASIYNILSSNIINLVQYLGTIILNKNAEKLKNKAIKTDIILVIVTIIIPIALLNLNIELNISIVPLFILLYALFSFLNNNAHKMYLNKEEVNEETMKKQKKNKLKILMHSIVLLITGVLLYIVGELLGNTLENLCNLFGIPQMILGILLGLITSIPELITFFESQKYYKKEKDDMIGVVEATNNLLTSNALNLFIIQTIGIVITNI